MIQTRFFIFFLFASLTLPYPLYASDFQSPRTVGLGGAGHAGPVLNDVIYMNPSFASFAVFRSFSANYLLHASDEQNPATGKSSTSGRNYNVSILDGSPDSLFQAGLGFTKRDDANFIHVGAAKSIINRIGIGLGSKFIFPLNGSNRIIDGTLSVSGIATTWFQGSLQVDNLLGLGESQGFYREFTLGTKFNVFSIISIFIDPHWVPTLNASGTAWGYEAGIEFTILTDFFLRFGKFANAEIPYYAARGNGYGFGVGWMGPRIAVDYAYKRVVDPRAGYSHHFGLDIFF